MRGIIIAALTAVILTGCNNNADIEARFQHFVKENNYEEDISHEEPPGEERVEFDLKEHISVEHYTRDTWFDRGEMQLGTRIRGPAGEKWIDDYVALLELSLESPDTTGFAFERMLEDLMVRGYPNSENYFTDGIHIHMQHYSDDEFENGKVLNVYVYQNFPEETYGDGRSEKVEERGIKERLKPQPRYLEMTEEENKFSGIHKQARRLITQGKERVNGYIEWGDDEDLSYYNHLDKTLDSYIPYTEKVLDIVEIEAVKKDLEETYELLQDLDKNTGEIESYAENEKMLRLSEIYRDLDYYVLGSIESEPSDSTYFFKNVVEAENE
ncbi:hypothetical protein [Salibacterium aidingense]|uniref:hypothetical protein n=1 Tax=Salibacterium aidingense TaxID=384933 RepID=UPI003BE2DF0C